MLSQEQQHVRLCSSGYYNDINTTAPSGMGHCTQQPNLMWLGLVDRYLMELMTDVSTCIGSEVT